MSAAAAADPQRRVATLLDSIEILSETTFRIGGGPEIAVAQVPVMPVPRAMAESDGTAPYRLRDALATLIYAGAYARVYDGGAIGTDILGRNAVADQCFLTSLSQANRSVERWDGGWKVYQVDPSGALHVQKGDSATFAPAGRYVYTAAAGPPGVGAYVELFAPRESLVDQPGWYHAYGETVMSDHDNGRIARLYFHLPAEEAAWVLGRLTEILNRYVIPFRIKCLADPAHYDRADSMVLYVARRFLPAALRVLGPLAPELTGRLRPGTPLFALPLLPGLGAADDPGTGESFGQSRSRILAEAVVVGLEAGGFEAPKDALAERFRRLGLDIKKPYLAAGLSDKYAIDFGGAA